MTNKKKIPKKPRTKKPLASSVLRRQTPKKKVLKRSKKIISSYVGGHPTNQPYNPNAITYYTPTPGSSIPATTLTNKSNYELASYKDILSNKSSVDSYLDMLTKKTNNQESKKDDAGEKEQNTDDINVPRKRTGSFDRITFDKSPIKLPTKRELVSQEYYKKTGIPAKAGMTISMMHNAIKEHDEKRHDIHEVYDDPLPFVNRIVAPSSPDKTELKQLKKEQKEQLKEDKRIKKEAINKAKNMEKNELNQMLKADKESKKLKKNNNNNNLTSHDVTIDNIYPESPNVKSLISQFNGVRENPLSKTRKATKVKPVVILNKDGTMRTTRSKK